MSTQRKGKIVELINQDSTGDINHGFESRNIETVEEE